MVLIVNGRAFPHLPYDTLGRVLAMEGCEPIRLLKESALMRVEASLKSGVQCFITAGFGH